jgi:lipopolysaccharide transport system ATP-binding protein
LKKALPISFDRVIPQTMSDPIITVESLSKRYLVGHLSDQRGRYTTLRDVIARGVREFTRKAANMARGQQVIQGDEVEEFWALKDVSFEVERGEVLGIIGRNGAGKSTLLKILSRITDPTEGRIVLRGRVASLLEVGTGFHQELTGRENIFLNGAILGMTQREIRKKFDEIVAFAEVDRFLDTPVKRYSSGMYVRLAFAVAAHLEPEILVVDEVLAVGDAEFQKKSLGKMSEVARDGRTVLFVSHNMGAVKALCSRAIVLANGKIIKSAPAAQAVETYLQSSTAHPEGGSEWNWNNSEVLGDATIGITKVGLIGSNGQPVMEVRSDEDFQIKIQYEQKTRIRGHRINLRLVTQLGEIAFTTSDHSSRTEATGLPGTYVSSCRIAGQLLNIGRYTLRLGVDQPGIRIIQKWFDVGTFTVVGHHNGGTTYPDAIWEGVVSPLCPWVIQSISSGENAEQLYPATVNVKA